MSVRRDFFGVEAVLGFELRTSYLLGSCCTLAPFYQPCFVLGTFEIGS
jgi:hypothetical protein